LTGSRSAHTSTRAHTHAGLKKKLKDLMGEFSELRARIHDENRQVVERRVYAVTGQHLPEDDIDHMIETGGGGAHVEWSRPQADRRTGVRAVA
jgi:syntaxin 1B/2/3